MDKLELHFNTTFLLEAEKGRPVWTELQLPVDAFTGRLTPDSISEDLVDDGPLPPFERHFGYQPYHYPQNLDYVHEPKRADKDFEYARLFDAMTFREQSDLMSFGSDIDLDALLDDAPDVDPDGARPCLWKGCSKGIFVNQLSIVEHIEEEHVNSFKGEEFVCLWQDCSRKTRPFNARYKLVIHMRVHTGHKPNKCNFPGCGKAFSRLENLKIHGRSHTGERPYKCQAPKCTKAFSNSSDRAKHQRTHFNARPYACQVVGCSKRYTDPSSLRKHVKNHSGGKQTIKRVHDDDLHLLDAKRKVKEKIVGGMVPNDLNHPEKESDLQLDMKHFNIVFFE